MKKPLSVTRAILAGTFCAILFAILVFAIVSIFTSLWPFGCLAWFFIVAGVLSFVLYDLSQPDDEDPTDDSITK